ncbi:MAG: 3-keto-5-aminohexanoate cleavage protein, partial [Myxococcota bacterium]
MSQPCIITVAITGSVPKKSDNPAVPITPAEQVESTHEAFEAGAALVHLHVREDDGSTSANPERFAEVLEGIRRRCPGMIIQFSTGGRSASGAMRGGMLDLRPDMASLATGSCNFPTMVYDNPPALIETLASKMRSFEIKPEIEVFDLAMLFNAARYVQEGLLESPLHVQFVMGVKNALPARRDLLETQVRLLEELLPNATWVAAGIGRHQLQAPAVDLEL